MGRTKRRPAATPRREWEPLYQTYAVVPSAERMEEHVRHCTTMLGVTEDEARLAVMENFARPCETWRNDKYVITVDRNPDERFMEGFIHLSIRRDDRKPIRDWRDFQRIKNEIAGPEREAVELYPAESRVIDTANQYHLWVLPEGGVVPAGWFGAQLLNDLSAGGSVQRPRSPEGATDGDDA